MGFVSLGKSGLKVSRACLGTMTFGNTEWGTDESESRTIVDTFLDAGHNFIDTADVYNAGVSEEFVGRAIAGRRDGGRPRHQGIQHHGARPQRSAVVPSASDPCARGQSAVGSVRTTSTSISSTTGTTTRPSRRPWPPSTASSGRERSAISAARTSTAASWSRPSGRPSAGAHPLVSLQPQYSLIWRDIELDILPTATRHGMGVIVWSPLGGGMLTGKYPRGISRPTVG